MPKWSDFVMIYEPEIYTARFHGMAERWERISGYSGCRVRRHGPVSGVYYQFPAVTPLSKGVRLAFFSDLHYTGTQEEQLNVLAAAELAAEFRPDYLLFGGDIAGHSVDLETSFSGLSYFHKLNCVKLAVPGNWESGKPWVPADFWKNHFHRYGFQYLVNNMYMDQRCAIYGLGDFSGGNRARRPEWSPDVPQRIILTHRPDNAVAIDSWRRPDPLAPLIFCGHLHGGQIRLPWIGPIYSKSSFYGRMFDYGVYRHNRGDHMVISCGMGELSCPIRFCCRREIVLVELQ
ncbi:MAG: metallophosphoesterase [Lentisphaeria bacterium]|nr:metallophosphoesterase [Lentisphaeria bacterium]